jgi:hypothetical protein
MYLAAYNNTAGAGQLMTANLTTGAATLIGNFQGNAEIDGVAIPYTNVPTGKTLNLSYVFLEGLYAGSNTMNPAYDEVGPHFLPDTADMITVELHNSTTYATIEYSTPGALKTNGTATVTTPADKGDSYYVTIRHRNSIEATSALPVDFSGAVISYAFDSQSKAYGLAAYGVPGIGLEIDGTAVIYAADVNQDGAVDGSDLSAIGNKVDAFAVGYLQEDVNGDGAIDGSDLSIAGNNNDAFIAAQLP